MSASDLLKAHEKEIKRHKFSQPTSTSVSSTPSSKQDTPMLGRGLAPGSDIFFDESPNIRKRKSSDLDRAKVCVVIGVSNLQLILLIERFSLDCSKTKTKVITLDNHNRRRQSSEPIGTQNKYISPAPSAGKRVPVSHNWFWSLIG